MKEYPILFNTEMVKAILSGKKTQTRRLKAGWKVGDILYVRETHVFLFKIDEQDKPIPDTGKCYYRADGYNPTPFNQFLNPKTGEVNLDKDCPYWTPSILMPKKFSRIKLRVTEMRTEKLQDISESDAEAEGIDFLKEAHQKLQWNHYPDTSIPPTAIQLFCCLWLSCSKPGFRWSDNPEVIVTNFERVEA